MKRCVKCTQLVINEFVRIAFDVDMIIQARFLILLLCDVEFPRIRNTLNASLNLTCLSECKIFAILLFIFMFNVRARAHTLTEEFEYFSIKYSVDEFHEIKGNDLMEKFTVFKRNAHVKNAYLNGVCVTFSPVKHLQIHTFVQNILFSICRKTNHKNIFFVYFRWLRSFYPVSLHACDFLVFSMCIVYVAH